MELMEARENGKAVRYRMIQKVNWQVQYYVQLWKKASLAIEILRFCPWQ